MMAGEQKVTENECSIKMVHLFESAEAVLVSFQFRIFKCTPHRALHFLSLTLLGLHEILYRRRTRLGDVALAFS